MHHHVFDSANGVDQYGTLIVLKCKCGLGRVLSGKCTSVYPPASIHRYNANLWEDLPREFVADNAGGHFFFSGLFWALAIELSLAFALYVIWRMV